MIEDQQKAINEKFNQTLKASDSAEEFEANSTLSHQLEQEVTSRKEERLLWIILCIILADVMLLKDSQNWTLTILIGLLELVLFSFYHILGILNL